MVINTSIIPKNEQNNNKETYISIPQELKNIKAWVVWKLEKKNESETKIPYQLNGQRASSTDPNTWTSYEEALRNCGDFSGLGFVLTKDNPYTVLDLDNCIDQNGKIKGEAKSLVDTLDSYTEISQSGKGLHIFIKAEKPGNRSKNTKKNVELYDDKRFIVMTGNQFEGTPNEIYERQDIFDYIYDSYFPVEKTTITTEFKKTDLKPSPKMSDEEILSIARKAKNKEKFIALYDKGDIHTFHNGDESSGDMGLCNMLAFYTQDPEQLDRLMRGSALNRDKYDEHEKYLLGDGYTVEKAIEGLDETYQKKTNPNINGLELSDKEAVIPNARNAEKILTSSPFKGVLAFDVFKGTEVIKGNLPWRKRERPDNDYEPWLGSDDKRLLHYFGVNFDFNAAKIIENAYLDVVRRNAFHPVKDYLEAQSWDGIPRAETLFIDYLGAEDTPYTREVTRKWLAAAVTRIYEPGCKFDYMPVLVGPQGVGKSTIIAKLARDWFSDSLKNLDGKEAYEHLQASWIFEFGELAAMRKNEVEEIKAFITKQTDSYRVAYERVVSDFPRKCVFIGTTNRRDFLRDQTGNRRFWAITTNPMNRKYEISDLTDNVVGQIWAEVMNLYKQGEKLYLDPALEAEARIIQESHMESDPRVGLIEEYLDRLLPPSWNTMKIYERVNFIVSGKVGEIKRERVCAAEIWSECLGNDHNNFKPFEAAAIYDILRKIEGWEERKPNRTTFKHYGKQTTFVRCV